MSEERKDTRYRVVYEYLRKVLPDFKTYRTVKIPCLDGTVITLQAFLNRWNILGSPVDVSEEIGNLLRCSRNTALFNDQRRKLNFIKDTDITLSDFGEALEDHRHEWMSINQEFACGRTLAKLEWLKENKYITSDVYWILRDKYENRIYDEMYNSKHRYKEDRKPRKRRERSSPSFAKEYILKELGKSTTTEKKLYGRLYFKENTCLRAGKTWETYEEWKALIIDDE